MFCARCGTQIPDDSAFCENCGAPIAGIERERRRKEAEAAGAPVEVPVGAASTPMQPPPGPSVPPAYAPPPPAAPPPPMAQAPRPVARPAVGARAALGLPLVGIIAIAGGLLAAVGCILPWIDAFGETMNSFDFGYVLNADSPQDGVDGAMIVPLGLIAAALGAFFFRQINSLAGIGLLAVGAAIMAIASWNLWKIFDNSDSSLEFVGIGLYVTLVGGAGAIVAGLVALNAGKAGRA